MNESEEITPMDCSRFEQALDDLDRAGTPGLALREAALAHAEGCGHCAHLMTDMEALDFSLRTLAAQDANLQAPPRVEAALLEELRQRKEAASRWRVWQMAALGVAAAVLLALGLAVRHLPVGGGETAGHGTADHGISAATAVAGSGAGASSVEVAENVSSDAQDETAFVSLPYATDPGALEGGTVVRVELSRAALASMGMPVADAGSTDRIPADIILSEDGAPQAIRLVSPASVEQ